MSEGLVTESLPVNSTNDTASTDLQGLDVYKAVAGSAVFFAVLPFILFECRCLPIGTTLAMLLGAFGMVVLGLLTQDEAMDVLGSKGNLRTIYLLLGMMIISQFFEREGIIRRFLRLWMTDHLTFHAYLWRISILGFVVAAAFTNDASCVILTPLLLRHWRSQRRDSSELNTLLLAIATSTNIGSAVTIFGNPQMALIAAKTDTPQFRKSSLTLGRSVIYIGPAALVGIVLNTYFLMIYYIACKRFGWFQIRLPEAQTETELEQLNSSLHHASFGQDDKEPEAIVVGSHTPWKRTLFKVILCLIMLLTVTVLAIPPSTFHFDLGLVPMAGAIFTLLFDSILFKERASVQIRKVDFSVLVLFMGMFVFMRGFNKTGLPRWLWDAAKLGTRTDLVGMILLCVFIVFASQVFSNVPLTLLLLEQLEPDRDYLLLILLLSWSATIAGNLTLFGSVANLIVVQQAEGEIRHRLSFWAYFVFGIPSTLTVVAVGIGVIVALASAFRL